MKNPQNPPAAATLMGTFPADEAAKLFPREKGYNFTVVAMDGGAHVELWKGTTRVGKFAVSPLPGCGGTLVFHDSEIDSTCRNRGHGVYLHQLRLAWAKAYGAGLVVCTTLTGNRAQNKILEHYGWEVASTQINPRTGHEFAMWTKTI